MPDPDSKISTVNGHTTWYKLNIRENEIQLQQQVRIIGIYTKEPIA